MFQEDLHKTLLQIKMNIQLSTGAIATLLKGGHVDKLVIQILGFKKTAGQGGHDNFKLNISDGLHSHTFAMLATELNFMFLSGYLNTNCIIRVDNWIVNTVSEKRVLLIQDLTVIVTGSYVGRRLGNPVQFTEQNANIGVNMRASAWLLEPASTQSSTSSFTVASSTSSASNAEEIWKRSTISVQELSTLETNRVLLVDCRVVENFNNQKIARFECVNVSSILVANSVTNDRFVRKAVIVQFLQEHCSALLEVLHVPGFYKSIIVFDEDSTSKCCSQLVIFMHKIFSNWNENTGTATLRLEGGLNAIRSSQGNQLIETPSVSHLQWAAAMLMEANTFDSHRCGERETLDVTDRMNTHLDNLNLAINLCKNMLSKRKALKSLIGIKLVLIKEEEDSFLEVLIPDALRCPVCFELFTKKILQCTNGHCICSRCVINLQLCPECRAPYSGPGGKVRNRGLETLMMTMSVIECPFRTSGCFEKLTYNQLNNHLRNCEFKKNLVTPKLDANILVIEKEVEAMSGQLEILNVTLGQSEFFYNTNAPSRVPSAPFGLFQEILSKNVDFVNLKIKVMLAAEPTFN